MRKSFLLLLAAAPLLFFTGCSNNSHSRPIKITAITEISTIDTGTANDVRAYGDYLYYTGQVGSIVNDFGVFGIVDFTDPTNPVILSTLEAGNAYGVDFDGRYAFVETDGGGTGIFAASTLAVIDCLNPASPLEVTENDLGYSSAWDVELNGNYLYNFSYDIIGVYDVTDPPNIDLVENIATNNDTLFGRAFNNYLYTVETGSLLIFDISAPADTIPEVGSLAIPGIGYGATSDGVTAYVASNDSGNKIYSVDVTDPTDPIIIGSVDTTTFISHEMRLLGNYLLANGEDQFVVIDVTDPANMTLVDSIDLLSGNGIGFDISGNYAIVADGDRFRVVELY